MSKYNLSCTYTKRKTYSNIWTFRIFSFRGQKKNKNAAQNITGKSQVQSTKIRFQEKFSKIN